MKPVNLGNYQIEVTGDGSPTLRWLDHPQTESMHNPQGALSESVFVYGGAFDTIVSEFNVLPKLKMRCLVVGLGMGYIEMILGLKAWKLKVPLEITSYEIDPQLRKQFNEFLNSPKDQPLLFQVWTATKDFLGISENLNPKEIISEFRLRETFGLNTLELGDQFECISYDPFSSKTNSELWSENFLTDFLNQHAAATCVFSTFAATGNLNRALKNSGFTRIPKSGYGTKRESTLGLKKSNSGTVSS